LALDCDEGLTVEFTATDVAVQQIARIFSDNEWKWGPFPASGQPTPFVPDATAIAAQLNELYDHAKTEQREHVASCERCLAGDSDYCPGYPDSGNCSSGRLWVEWMNEGYGDDLTFGVWWERPAL